MKSSLSHLPEPKQEQILLLVDLIKQISPAKVLLYGSHARGDWQQDWSVENNSVQDFNSDYDFLVVLKNGNDIKEMSLSEKLNNLLRSRAPVNALVHSIDQVNHSLEFGHYFFVDIINEGILLYDTGEVEFAKPKELTKDEKRQRANDYFDYWFSLSIDFLDTAELNFIKAKEKGKRLNFATYNLFQAAEGLYSTILLVHLGYKPRTHNLDKLRSLSKNISKEFDSIFPRSSQNKEDGGLFELLKSSYIGAKYKMDFKISEDELAALLRKIRVMSDIVQKSCLSKINSLGK